MSGRHSHKHKKNKTKHRPAPAAHESPCQEHPDRQEENDMKATDQNPPARNSPSWIGVATTFLSILALFAYFTQACIMRQAMRIDQRAWIGVDVKRGQLVNQEPITMPIKLINAGKTPALKVRGPIVVNLLKEDEEPDFTYVTGHPRYDIQGKTILPNLPQEMAFSALPQHVDPNKPLEQILVTDTVRQEITDGKLYIVVHGEISYEDIFGIPHWIRFCNYAHDVVGFRQQSVANTCGQYNDVDKND